MLPLMQIGDEIEVEESATGQLLDALDDNIDRLMHLGISSSSPVPTLLRTML